MDPLSIATSVGSLSGACLLTLRNLGEAISKFKDAPKTLKDISSEAKIISISLSQLRNALVSDEYSISTQGLLEPDIRNALDIALTGCKMTLSCIETEISSLTKGMATDQGLTFSDRAKVFWKDDKFKELLQQLSRQHNAIATLQQGFQMKALGDMVKLMVTNRATIQKVADGTQSLRGLYPQFNTARSFLESIKSGDSHEHDLSVISERQFEFDDIVTSAQAYRRVLVAATHTLRTNSREQAPGEESQTRTTIDGGPAGQEDSNPQGANQSRKMNAKSSSWTGGPTLHSTRSPSSNALPEDGNSQSSTFRDSNSFAQQFRGYLDNVEKELRNSAEEVARLQALLQKKDAELERLQIDSEVYATALADAESERDHFAREDSNSRRAISVLHEEQKQLHKDLLLLRDKVSTRDHRLKMLGRENEELLNELEKSERQKEESVHAYNNLIKEMSTKEFQIQKLKAESDQNERNAKGFVHSVRSSRAAQLGTILLVPMQSPTWLDESIKGPPQFQLIDAPENSDGSIAKWDGQENKWVFANEPGMKEPDVTPIVPAIPGQFPEPTKTEKSSRSFPKAGPDSPRHPFDPNTHPLNLPPDQIRRLSALSAMSDPDRMDIESEGPNGAREKLEDPASTGTLTTARRRSPLTKKPPPKTGKYTTAFGGLR